MKIGIAGATGQLGSLVLEQLKSRTEAGNLVALVRSPEKVEGIEARAFDYEKPETLAAALEGIETLLLISGNEIGKRASQHENVIKAAQKAGIQWIVYTSILKADTTTISLGGEHLITEKLLKESGIEHTILRNGWYTENYTGSIQGALQAGAFVGSAGEGKIASAARKDFAEAAAVVLTDTKHKGKVYELAGDEAYTLYELAAEISKQSGKTIPYQNLPEQEYSKILKGIGIPDVFADGLASWDVSASRGDLYDDSHTLSSLIGHSTTSLESAVKTALN
ncbi:SDR family oxidoreductase [Jiulongibacter sediminis]|uniref:NmrA family transcriptional regulator n=1 Tax=Jiulongibacter sediminis TaxID=1605367 RepID=A0A0P7BR82_9BACT|nr:SDR family oxidoreductase [Jiulongibacter sediminis]KPM46755.1 NmrA family transcriptional regulator [Jiulongibacter sediminis]TBX21660.1 NmrA family transcriptional regulator [Jiulongibacter sediminis]